MGQIDLPSTLTINRKPYFKNPTVVSDLTLAQMSRSYTKLLPLPQAREPLQGSNIRIISTGPTSSSKNVLVLHTSFKEGRKLLVCVCNCVYVPVSIREGGDFIASK